MAKRLAEITVRLRDRASAQLRQIGQGFTRLTTNITRVASVGAGLGAFFGARLFTGAIRSAADFEAQMSVVAAVTRASGEEFSALQKAAEEAGASTRFTATEAAQGLEELSRAGFNARQSIEGLNPTLNTAQANNIEVARSAEILTDSLNAFDLGADQIQRFADVLTRASQTSATNIDALAESLRDSAPLARGAGLTFEETTGILSRFADFGFRGTQSGVAFRNALIDLNDPASNFRSELQKLGITSTDIVDVLTELSVKGADSEAAIRGLGRRGVAPVTSIINGSIDSLQGLITGLENSGGAAQQAADVMDDNLNGALKNLGSAYDALRRNLVTPLLGPLAEQARALAEQFRNAANSEGIKRLGERIAQIFNEGARAVREFFSDFDFEAATDTAIESLSRLQERIGNFADGASEELQTLRNIGDGIGLVFNGINAAVLLASAGVARSVELFQQLRVSVLEAGESVERFFGNDSAADRYAAKITEIQKSIGGLEAVQEEFFRRAKESLDEGSERWARLEEAANSAGRSAEKTGDKIVKAVEEAGPPFDETLNRFYELNDQLKETQDNATDAADAVGSIGDEKDTIEAVGSATGDLNSQLQNVADTVTQRLGREADTALANLQGRLNDETATVKQINDAFVAYARARITANKGIVEAELRTQAATLGVSRELDTLEQEAEQAAKALAGIDDSGQGLDNVAQSAGRASQAVAEVGKETEATEESVGGLSSVLGGALESAASLSNGARLRVQELSAEFNRLGPAVPQAAFKALGDIIRQVNQEFSQQTQAADALIARYEQQGDALAFVGRAAVLASDGVSLLDNTRLDKLTSIIAEAREQMQGLRQDASDGISELQRELDELRGIDSTGNERLQQRADIVEKISQANATANRELAKQYQQQLRLLDQIIAQERNRAAEQAATTALKNEQQLFDARLNNIQRLDSANAQATERQRARSGQLINDQLDQVLGGLTDPVRNRSILETLIEQLRRRGQLSR